MKKMLFIYNPHAGKSRMKSKLSSVIDIFVKAGFQVVVYPTQKTKDAYELTKALAADYDVLTCSGGDGTLDEVITGLMEIGVKIPVGYIPAGSTNDFANSLKIPKNIHLAAQTIVNGTCFPCDIGTFNQDTFVYIAAFGLFTDVSYETKQEVKNILGHSAYVLEAMKRLGGIKTYQATVYHDGATIKDEFIYGMVTNSVSVGGFQGLTGKNVRLNDGKYEVTLIKAPKNPLELQNIVAALLIQSVKSDYIYTFKTSELEIEFAHKVSWTLDGEYGGYHTKVSIRNNRQALPIFVNKRPDPVQKKKKKI